MRAKSEHSGPPNTRFIEIHRVAQTGSTNEDLLLEASNGAPEGLVLVADHQSSGHGRQGRKWLDGGVAGPDGSGEESASSLLVSWLLRPNSAIQADLTIIPLLTGLAVANSLHDDYGLGIGVKWPNDLLSRPSSGRSEDERKLAGILVQGSTIGSDTAVIVGLGLNLRPSDSCELGGVATDIQTLFSEQALTCQPPDRFDLLNSILSSVETLLRLLEGDGAEAILALYRERCVTLGRGVEMHTPGGVIAGEAVAISSNGGLVIETGSGRQTVTAGDAHHIKGPREEI